VDTIVILGWIPLGVGIAAALWLIWIQPELPVVGLAILLAYLAAAHWLAPPIPPHSTWAAASWESAAGSPALWPALARLGVEVAAAFAVFALWRHLGERDANDDLHWSHMDSVRKLAEFFERTPTDPAERRRHLFALGCEVLRTEIGLLSRIEGERYEIVALHSAGEHIALKVGFVAELDETLCSRTLRVERALGIERAGELANCALPFGSYLGIPVRVHGEVFGTLCYGSREPRPQPFRGMEKLLLGLMAGWLGRDLEREAAAAVRLDAERPAASLEPMHGGAHRSTEKRPYLDLNATIRRLEKRLLAGLGPDHSLELHLAGEAPRVSAPVHLFVQVLLGLVANAVETLPEGGALEIATGSLEAGESGPRASRYATVVVRTRAGAIEGGRLIDLMEEAPARREDALSFRRLRRLLARMEGDHSVHCDPEGGVVLTAYLPEAQG
jgi:hypothetical protein